MGQGNGDTGLSKGYYGTTFRTQTISHVAYFCVSLTSVYETAPKFRRIAPARTDGL